MSRNYEKTKNRTNQYKMMLQKLQPSNVPAPMMTKIPQGARMKPFLGKFPMGQVRHGPYHLAPLPIPPQKFVSPIQKM